MEQLELYHCGMTLTELCADALTIDTELRTAASALLTLVRYHEQKTRQGAAEAYEEASNA